MSEVKCTLCKSDWDTLDRFLEDNSLLFNGYQPYPNKPEKGLFLFTHKSDSCGTTLSLKVQKFKKLSDESTKFSMFVIGKEDDCEGHCLDGNDLSTCNSKNCPGTDVRKLIKAIQEQMVDSSKTKE